MMPRDTRALADELPYLCCGEFEGFGPLHLLADDTLGYAFEIPVPVVDTQVDGEAAVAHAIAVLLHALPPGMRWQWFVRAEPDVEAQLHRYCSQRGEDASARRFGEAFVQRWREAQRNGFFPEQEAINFFPRTLRIAIALKSAPLGLAHPGLVSTFGTYLQAIRPLHQNRALASFWQQLSPESKARKRGARFVAAVRDVLAAIDAQGWRAQALDGGALLRWVVSILFPQRPPGVQLSASPGAAGSSTARWSEAGNELRDALAAMGSIEDMEPQGFRTHSGGHDCHHRVVSMLWQPRAVAPGMLNALAEVLPWVNVVLTIAPIAPTAALLQLKARALLNARSTHRFNETEMQARSEALREVEQRIFAEGERVFEMRLQVHIAAPTALQAQEAGLRVCKLLESMELECALERDIGATLLLRACLPFACYPETERKLRRGRRFLSRDCADLHPGGGSWTGTAPAPFVHGDARPAPIVMYANPLGEPLFLDPTQAEKNPHALVVGQSGSGKSFFVHDYLLHLWRLPDVRLFLLSIKADYRKLALLLGRYVEVSLDTELSLNPFCGRPTLENQARWFAALSLMLPEGDKQARLSREAEVALQSAVMHAAQRNWDSARDVAMRETLLEHVCLELERSFGSLGRQLAAQLHPYRKGPYRQLFNSPRGIHPGERFVFFNLGNILNQPCAALASFCVFSLIDEVMTDPSLRGVPKGLIADEVWALVRNSHAAAILERSLKAYRSLGGFALPIVQDPKDLDTPSGRVMLVNTATKIVLPLDPAGQADLPNYIRLNEREMELVRNLRLVKRRYSEFFVSIDGMKSAKGLLIPDPLRYAIATTDPGDEERIERHYRACGNMLEAVQRFARESPYGLPGMRGDTRTLAGPARGASLPLAMNA
jgi:conjugal transfer ATP-binding protein TraC